MGQYYAIINADGEQVWTGVKEVLAYHIIRLCEKYPEQFFRVDFLYERYL